MNIIVDAFGGDNAPLEIIKGCVDAIKEYEIDITLVGSKDIIKDVASKNNLDMKNINIVHTEDIITMEDHADTIMKEKNESSMAKGLKMLAAKEGDAFMSAGNSGALALGATMIVKRIKGISRAAMAAVMPKSDGFFMLLDVGANVDCRPIMLEQFGLMGYIYMKNVMGIKNPRVGLANIGTEEHKGGDLQHKAYELLQNSNINFIGNIEAREIPFDAADVVVADGFTGNIILKTFEGVSNLIMGKVKDIFSKNIKTKLAAAMILWDIKSLKNSMDYNEFGGAPLIGLKAPVFKAHGSARARTVKNAIRLCVDYARNNVVSEIETEINLRDCLHKI